MAELLSQSISASVESVIDGLQSRLLQLEREQQAVAASIDEVDASLVTSDQMATQKAMMAKVSVYHTKLLAMRSAMSLTAGRTKILQQKADKLKAAKLNYLNSQSDIQQMERAHDEAVAAKLAPSPDIPSPTPSTPDLNASPPKVAVKIKKKKPRARHVEIGEDNDPAAWMPSRSKSQTPK